MDEAPPNRTSEDATETSQPANGRETPEAEAQPSNKLPFTQILSTWSIGLLTAVAYALTVCYGFGNDGLVRISWIVTSPRWTLLSMQALSQATGLLLMPLVNGAFERLQWMLASRKGGMSLAGFLALGSGTGIAGLIGLAFRGRGGRIWAILRFVLIIVAPIMSVVLFADTETRLVFTAFEPFPVAGGIGTFNASYAGQWQPLLPTYIANDYSRLLQDPKYSFPIAPVTETGEKCMSTDIFGGEKPCGSGYFLHGGFGLVTPWPTANNSLPDATIYQLLDIQGLQLDFRPLDRGAVFRGETDCIVIGSKLWALQICLSGSDDGSINAKYLHCPISNQVDGTCLSDSTWQSSTGWTVSMSLYRRRATVHFTRYNMSAMSLRDISAPDAVTNIEPSEILNIYNTTFSSSQSLRIAENIATYLTYSETSSTNWNEAGFNLRNLLTIPFYYFQPTYMSPWVMAEGDHPDSTLTGLPSELYATASFANPSYRLIFAPWTIWSYTIVTGVILLLSILVLVLGSTVALAGRAPETGLFPVVDFVVNATVKDGGKGAGDKGDKGDMERKPNREAQTETETETETAGDGVAGSHSSSESSDELTTKERLGSVKNIGIKAMDGFRVVATSTSTS